MHRLIYVSLASPDLEQEDYANILNVSKAFNAAHDITGLLAYNGVNFMQALEGPEAPVVDLYLKIVRDLRHHGVVGIYSQTISARAFPDWAMQFVSMRPRGINREAITSRNAKIDQYLPATVPQDVRDLFANFNALSVR